MNVAPGGWRWALLIASPSVPAAFVTPYASVPFLLAGAFALWFFRDPDRVPAGPGVVAPADGTVSVVREQDDRLRVGVYMSAFDVHVNRAPLGGSVEAVEHTPGAHRPAFAKDSDRNERVAVDFGDHRVVLIAGWFARRITPYVEMGDTLERGDRLGHIAFGSRADVVLPAGYERGHLNVGEGDVVRAGETVLARQ
ncbi:MAG: protein sorting system archaetidylserine decarboxylase [Halobacteriales archaeon]